MAGGYFTAVGFGVLLSMILIAPASAEDWFYPDATLHQAAIPPDWGRTGAVLVRVESAQSPPLHPDVAHIEWLTRQPAVARLTLSPGVDDLALSRELHARDEVHWAHPDFILPLTVHSLPSDPFVDSQWHLENTGQSGAPGTDINAATAWQYATGFGQIISIIDSGVDADHPDLAVIGELDVIDGDTDSYPENDNAHGTACAGLAASIGNNDEGGAGVAYDAEIFGVRFIGANSASAFYDAFTDSVDAGATVLSNSWGSSAACDGYSLPSSYHAAMDYAETDGRGGLGAAVVFAAGNDNCDISMDGFLVYDTVVAVAALSSGDVRESYSSFGTPVDIAAPSGGLITTDLTGDVGYGSYSDDNNYTGGMSGTSAAAPLVAGVFALMFEANERLTIADARDVMCQTATRIDVIDAEYDSAGWSPYYGCGRVDAGAAVAAVANVAPEAPASTVPDTAAYEDRIWLDWTDAVDADSDRLTYRVTWWVDDDDPVEVIVDGLSLELTGEAVAEQTISWHVTAIDLWGDGIQSDEYTLSVSARPTPAPVEEAGGCQAVGGGVWWLALLPLAGRRRH